MSWRGFAVEHSDSGVSTVRFTEPDRLNAMTQGMKRDLVEFLTHAQNEDAVRVLVFTGIGRAFCAGDDVSGAYHSPEQGAMSVAHLPPTGGQSIRGYSSLRWVSGRLTEAMRDFDKLTVAAINGPAIQSGLTFALGCDFRVMASDARLGSATLRFAYLPDEGGHHLLVEYLGVGRTLDFLLRKKIVGATEALELGLVNEVVEPAELMDRSLALAEELAAGPQVASRLLKRAIWNASESTLARSLDDIAVRAAWSDHHPDAAEGVAAFRERRAPRFNGD